MEVVDLGGQQPEGCRVVPCLAVEDDLLVPKACPLAGSDDGLSGADNLSGRAVRSSRAVADRKTRQHGGPGTPGEADKPSQGGASGAGPHLELSQDPGHIVQLRFREEPLQLCPHALQLRPPGSGPFRCLENCVAQQSRKLRVVCPILREQGGEEQRRRTAGCQ